MMAATGIWGRIFVAFMINCVLGLGLVYTVVLRVPHYKMMGKLLYVFSNCSPKLWPYQEFQGP